MPADFLNYGAVGILALAFLSMVGMLWRYQRTLISAVGVSKAALRLAESEAKAKSDSERMFEKVLDVVNRNSEKVLDVVERNSRALALVEATVSSNTETIKRFNGAMIAQTETIRGCPYRSGT